MVKPSFKEGIVHSGLEKLIKSTADNDAPPLIFGVFSTERSEVESTYAFNYTFYNKIKWVKINIKFEF